MGHNEYTSFLDLPDDARAAFDRALRWYRRQGGNPSAWSDIARRMWVDKMCTARPGITGRIRAKGLVIGARLVVLDVAEMWARANRA